MTSCPVWLAGAGAADSSATAPAPTVDPGAVGPEAAALAEAEEVALRRVMVEYLVAMFAGDVAAWEGRVQFIDAGVADIQRATIRSNAAFHSLSATVREHLGDAAATRLRGDAVPSRDLLESAAAQYKMLGAGAARPNVRRLVRRPRPRMTPVLPKLPSEIAFIYEQEDGRWRVLNTETEDKPAWVIREKVALLDVQNRGFMEVAAAVEAGEVANVPTLQQAIRAHVAEPMRARTAAVQEAIQKANASFAERFEIVTEFQGPEHPVMTFAFGAEGERLYVGLFMTTPSLFSVDVSTGDATHIPLSDRTTDRYITALVRVGDRLAVASNDASGRTLDDRKVVRRAEVASRSSLVELLDEEGTSIDTTVYAGRGMTVAMASRDGWLYTIDAYRFLRAYAPADLAKAEHPVEPRWEQRLRQAGSFRGLAANDVQIAAAAHQGSLVLVDRETGEANIKLLLEEDGAAGRLTAPIAFHGEHTLFAAALMEVKVLDLTTLQVYKSRSSDGKPADSGALGTLEERRLTGIGRDLARTNVLALAPGRDLWFSGHEPLGGMLGRGGEAASVQVWRLSDALWLGILPAASPITAIAVSDAGNLLAVGDSTGHVTIYRIPAEVAPVEPALPPTGEDH